jgi:hypothetical protein
MTLERVIANLERTIQGKRELLSNMAHYSGGSDLIAQATQGFVEVNVAELDRILQDLKRVQTAQHRERAASSWEKNPDRMGGCFTDEEIARSRGWR